MNKTSLKQRFIELIVDYFVIIGYLFVLLLLNMAINFLVIGGLPNYSELQAQLVALFTSVIPIILIFSYLDFYQKASIGKRIAGLRVTFTSEKFTRSLVRNLVKFLPWQLGHLGVIHGMYHEFSTLSILIANTGLVLGAILLMMGILRKDKRHIGDLIAGTQVIPSPKLKEKHAKNQ